MAVIGFFLGWKMSLTAFMLAVFQEVFMESDFSCQRKGCKRAFCIWPVFVRRDSADFICGRMAAFLVSIHNFLKGGTYAKVSIYGEGCRRKEEKRAAYGKLMRLHLRAFKGRKSVFDFLPIWHKRRKKIHIVLIQGSFLSSVGSLELCLAQVFRL